MLSPTRFLAPGVMVALLLVSSLPSVVVAQQDEGRPVPPIELPAVIPNGVRSGNLDTPLGPARWVHLVGDRALPGLGVD